MITYEEQARNELLLKAIGGKMAQYFAEGKEDKALRIMARLKMACTPRWQEKFKQEDFR